MDEGHENAEGTNEAGSVETQELRRAHSIGHREALRDMASLGRRGFAIR